MRQNSDSQVLHFWPELGLKITNQDSEAIAVLLLLFILELSISKRLLHTVPEGAKGTALLLYLHWGELPGKINSVKVVVTEESVHRVDELGSRFWCLGLRKFQETALRRDSRNWRKQRLKKDQNWIKKTLYTVKYLCHVKSGDSPKQTSAASMVNGV